PAADANPSPDESKRDEAALRAIDDHWGRAETEGDVAYLSELLAPEYRSIGVTGEATTRASLLDRAAQRTTEAARSDAPKATQESLPKRPSETSLVAHGSIGVVSFYNPKPGADRSVPGADVFVFENNPWHAVFSLHNGAE